MSADVIILPVRSRDQPGHVVACRISPDRFAALEALARNAGLAPVELAGWYLSEMIDSIAGLREASS